MYQGLADLDNQFEVLNSAQTAVFDKYFVPKVSFNLGLSVSSEQNNKDDVLQPGL